MQTQRGLQMRQMSWVIQGSILLALALTIEGCGSTDSREEAALYENYINAHQAKDRSGNMISRVVILDHTVGWEDRDPIEKAASELGVPKAVIENWKHRNTPTTSSPTANMGHTINSLLSFSVPHILISEDALSQIVDAGGWDEFHRRYPNSRYVAFSRVGFHWSSTIAMLYVLDQKEDAGILYMYVRTGSKWKESMRKIIWIS